MQKTALGDVLVVDDEPGVAKGFARLLRAAGFATDVASSGEEALAALEKRSFDVVLSDVAMPDVDGIELLRRVRQIDLDLPVVLVTGEPSVEAASAAVELKAFRYLLKPVDSDKLRDTIRSAVALHQLALARREVAQLQDGEARENPLVLRDRFQSAVNQLWMAYQPILSVDRREIVGYEALLRTKEKSVPHPGVFLELSRTLGALHLLGRSVRSRIADDIERAPSGIDFFVNLHPSDLADPNLYDPDAPLTAHAAKVVLEITERAPLDAVADLGTRIQALRGLGYRIAVDDLGAGYAALNYFATLEPDMVKLDMALIRGIRESPVRQRIVLSMTGLCRSLGMEVVAEGVETTDERDTLVDLGATHVQGYLFCRPEAPFPTAKWG